MIYNPYGTNTSSVNVYFLNNDVTLTSYKIEVSSYSTYENELVEDNNSYELIGFVMGEKNNLTLTFTNKEGNKTTKRYTLDFTSYKIDTDNKVKIVKDNSKDK